MTYCGYRELSRWFEAVVVVSHVLIYGNNQLRDAGDHAAAQPPVAISRKNRSVTLLALRDDSPVKCIESGKERGRAVALAVVSRQASLSCSGQCGFIRKRDPQLIVWFFACCIAQTALRQTHPSGVSCAAAACTTR
jgi:hypothetical protein